MQLPGRTNPLLRAFDPSSLGLTAWYRSGATSGDVASIPDVLGGTSIMFNAARAPTAQADKALAYTAATPDVGSILIGANNFNVNTLAVFFKAKPTAVATTQMLLSLNIGTNGAGVRCFDIAFASAALRLDVYSSGTNGRRLTYNTQVAAGTARMWGFEFFGVGAGENDRLVMTRNGAILTPSSAIDLSGGGSPTTLVNAAGGRMLWGNFNDSAVASNAYGGLLGWDIFIRAAARMSGATAGIMTQQARDNLNTYEPLT